MPTFEDVTKFDTQKHTKWGSHLSGQGLEYLKGGIYPPFLAEFALGLLLWEGAFKINISKIIDNPFLFPHWFGAVILGDWKMESGSFSTT